MAFKNPFEDAAKAVGQKVGDMAAGIGQAKSAIDTLMKGPIGVADKAKSMSIARRPGRRRR